MDQELNKAFQLVSQPNNQSIKQGEALLQQLKKNDFYPLALLVYMENNQAYEAQIRASIELKIWCESYEELEMFERAQFQQVIEDLKEKIVVAYLRYDEKIAKSLLPAVVALTKAEFPRKWNGLMENLVKFASQNSGSLLRILELIRDVTFKYSFMSRSDPLYEEIILVCDQTHDFLLSLTMNILQNNTTDNNMLILLTKIMEIFYHLNYQDLHPKFEDNIVNWMPILKKIMNFQNSSENAFKCKGSALEAILLYATKYQEDVEESIKGFSSEIWDLCSNATQDPEYDDIVFNSLKYFKSILLWQQMKDFFTQNLPTLIEKLIMPNLKINRDTLELFYGESEVFFDYYFKNADIQTRRAASLQLLRVIARHFPNYKDYVISNIQKLTENISIQEKCDLLNFIMDASVKSYRQIDGCVDTHIDAQLISQCYDHIVKNDLAAVYNWILENPTKNIEDEINIPLLVTLMRYVYYFRVYLNPENYELIIKFASSINTAQDPIRTMIFMVITSFLSIRHGDFIHYKNIQHYYNAENSQNVAKDILQTIYKNDSQYKMLDLNLTKMLLTLTRILGVNSVQYFEYFHALIAQMLAKTEVFDFKCVHVLFQAIGEVAYWVSKNGSADKEKLQAQIFKFFYISIEKKSDLINFYFQILSIFLHFENNNITEYSKIYSSILNPQNWVEENISIMSSYIQFISGYLTRVRDGLASDKEKFEIIFSKLVELEHYDLFYRFINSIINITTLENFQSMGYFKLTTQGTEAIIQKSIQGKKTGILFIFKLMALYDTKMILGNMSKYSPNLLENIINNGTEIIQTMQNRKDKRVMYLALLNVIQINILNHQMQGNLLSLLIDNSSNRYMLGAYRQHALRANSSEATTAKKQTTYQKLVVFKRFETPSQTNMDVDEEVELCKTYLMMQSQNRQSLQFIETKNQERMNRLIEKHKKSLNIF